MDERIAAMTRPAWRDVAQHYAIGFVGTAAFPRLSHRLRWPTRLGPRGLIAYIAFNTLLRFAIGRWLMPFFKRMADERDRAEQELREQLAREPAEDEILAHLGITSGRWPT
jgi:hypothetical protein